MRRRRPLVELISDIGAKAIDLHDSYESPVELLEALRFVTSVNPEIFMWLRDRLIDIDIKPKSAPAPTRPEEPR